MIKLGCGESVSAHKKRRLEGSRDSFIHRTSGTGCAGELTAHNLIPSSLELGQQLPNLMTPKHPYPVQGLSNSPCISCHMHLFNVHGARATTLSGSGRGRKFDLSRCGQ